MDLKDFVDSLRNESTKFEKILVSILNRIHSTDPFYPDFSREVITQAGQFSSITGDVDGTENARVVGKTTDRWENATFFYAYTTAQNGYTAGNCVFSGSGDNMKYGNKNIKQVYVLGYGTVTSFPNLFSSYFTNLDYSRNIYYNYK